MRTKMRFCLKAAGRISLILVLLMTSSCKNEDIPKSTVPEVSLKGTDCLKDTTDILEHYVNGVATPYEVNAFWNCFYSAITTFKTRVEGSDPVRGYKSTELRRFLETNFLGGDKPDAIKISDSLLAQFMQVKRLLIGGRSEYLTNAELNHLLNLFNELKGLTQELRPYIKVLFKSKKGEELDPDVVSVASDKFEEVLYEVGTIIAKQKVSYSLDDFKTFALELDKIFQARGNGDAFKKVAEFVPLIKAAKGVLFAGQKDVIGADEWNGLFRFAGNAFSISMRFSLFLGPDSMKTVPMLNEVHRMGRSVFMILNDAFARRPDHTIPNSDFDNLFAEYAAKYPLPMNLTLPRVKELWANLVDKIIPEYGTNEPGWSASELKRLENEFENCIGVQFYLIGSPRLGVALEAIEEMKGVLNTFVLPLDSLKRIVFIRDPNAVWDEASKTKLNLLRLAIRLLMQANTADPIRRQTLGGVDEKEFNAAYAAAKPFLVLLDVVKENDTELGPRIFQEANMFTTRANGDKFINFYEVLEYAHFVHSGIGTGKLMRASLTAPAVGSNAPLCANTSDSVDVKCFRAHYRQLFSQSYSNMPKMVSYLSGLKEKDWKKVLAGLEKTQRSEGPVDTPIANGDIYEIGVLFQYIEIVMLRFDADQNGVLDLNEGLTAFPVFQTIIASILNVDPVDDVKEVRALFTYMLRYGEPPNPGKPLTLLRYLNWKWSEKSWKLQADRGIILKILSSLSEH